MILTPLSAFTISYYYYYYQRTMSYNGHVEASLSIFIMAISGQECPQGELEMHTLMLAASPDANFSHSVAVTRAPLI